MPENWNTSQLASTHDKRLRIAVMTLCRGYHRFRLDTTLTRRDTESFMAALMASAIGGLR